MLQIPDIVEAVRVHAMDMSFDCVKVAMKMMEMVLNGGGTHQMQAK